MNLRWGMCIYEIGQLRTDVSMATIEHYWLNWKRLLLRMGWSMTVLWCGFTHVRKVSTHLTIGCLSQRHRLPSALNFQLRRNRVTINSESWILETGSSRSVAAERLYASGAGGTQCRHLAMVRPPSSRRAWVPSLPFAQQPLPRCRRVYL